MEIFRKILVNTLNINSQKSVRWESRYSTRIDVQADGQKADCLRSCCVKAPKGHMKVVTVSGHSGRDSDQVFHEDQFKEDYCPLGCGAV
jgi:hypothetical protein